MAVAAVSRFFYQGNSSGSIFRVLFHHHPMSGTGGIHALIIQNNLHSQFIRRLYNKPDSLKIALGQIRHILRHTNSGMQHKTIYTLFHIILKLLSDTFFLKSIIKEPKRDRGKFRPGSLKLSNQFLCTHITLHFYVLLLIHLINCFPMLQEGFTSFSAFPHT